MLQVLSVSQSASVVHFTVESPESSSVPLEDMQRLQSECAVHEVKVSTQKPLPRSGCMFHGAEQGIAACLETVLVETSDMEITRPEPDTLVFGAGGQSRDTPPNNRLVACTVQAVPASLPP